MDLDFVRDLVVEAGRGVLDVCEEALSAGKEILSSLELASGRAQRIISRGLQSCCQDIPVISKEDRDTARSTGVDLSRFWLVDPLDGAGESMLGSGEFTVNIALIERDMPVWGVVYAPARQTLYFAAKGEGCWKLHDGKRERLQVSVPAIGVPTRVVVNRSRISPDTVLLIDFLPSSATVGRESALKFCSIAEGEADFYPQLDATREWETAAGQIIVMEAGGVMTDLEGKPFTYNKAGLTNGPFLVAPSLGWLENMNLLNCRKRLAEWQLDYCAMSCR
jgi:3'(2'), 5'-bisphosphate nucleotidase